MCGLDIHEKHICRFIIYFEGNLLINIKATAQVMISIVIFLFSFIDVHICTS